MRRIAWFSCGAASAITAAISNPDVIVYCDTGSEHPDNARFMRDCEQAFGFTITILKSEKFRDTWHVWEHERYLAGIHGAACTRALKVRPRLAFHQGGDIDLWGYTADKRDMMRAESLREIIPDSQFPLIERGLNKAACLDLLLRAGVDPPLTYALGFEHANCIPCPKASASGYWALVRQHYPERFARMVELSTELGVKLLWLNGKRVMLCELPEDVPASKPIQPDCDLICQLTSLEMPSNFHTN